MNHFNVTSSLLCNSSKECTSTTLTYKANLKTQYSHKRKEKSSFRDAIDLSAVQKANPAHSRAVDVYVYICARWQLPHTRILVVPRSYSRGRTCLAPTCTHARETKVRAQCGVIVCAAAAADRRAENKKSARRRAKRAWKVKRKREGEREREQREKSKKKER